MTEHLRISICIPQYNRIKYLLKSLHIIQSQTYPHIEISISDDCSTDETESAIRELIPKYRFPIHYVRNTANLGYDRNFRKCIEMASGDYAVVIGNDDSLHGDDAIAYLVELLREYSYPDIGFCNMIEDSSGGTTIGRATTTGVLGTGPQVAMKHYSCFSFVGGLIFKRETFLQYNTAKYDGSIYSQIYLGVLMISKGATIFSIQRPLVRKDLVIDDSPRKSYLDTIARKWADYKVVDAGLPSVINVLIAAFRDAGQLKQAYVYSIFRRIYLITFPYWILDYKEHGAFPESVGLIAGMNPRKNVNFKLLNWWNRIKVYTFYSMSSVTALATPLFIYKGVKQKLYSFFKR